MSKDSFLSITFASLEQRAIVAASTLQGLLLYWLYRNVEAGRWPSGEPIALYVLATLLITAPLFFMLSLQQGTLGRVLRCTAGYAVIVCLLAAYAGWQRMPQDLQRGSVLVPIFILTIAIASFKALLYTQQYARGEAIHYPALLQNSWRIFLLAALSGLFTLLFWLVLMLWGALFKLINITVFSEVFSSQWFMFPASTMAFGFAVILFNNLDHIIDNVARLLKTMLRFLLPLLALVAVLFLIFLPFTGLQSIWSSKLGSATLLWLVALLMFFTNAVYQYAGDERPYSPWLHRLIAVAVASLPLYCIIAFNGLFTRIAQYGLTVDRCWGVIVSLLLFGFASGYLWSIVQKRDQWLIGLQRINTGMGLVLIAALVAVNSPLLNLQQLSVHSQLARLDKGLTLESLDIGYFRNMLGRAGYEALDELKQRYADSKPDFVASINRLYAGPGTTLHSAAEIQSKLVVWPTQREVPTPVLNGILGKLTNPTIGIDKTFAVFSDLDGDGQDEIITLFEVSNADSSKNYYSNLQLWVSKNGEWSATGVHFKKTLLPPALLDNLRNNQVEIVKPRWQNLQIGDVLLIPEETFAETSNDILKKATTETPKETAE